MQFSQGAICTLTAEYISCKTKQQGVAHVQQQEYEPANDTSHPSCPPVRTGGQKDSKTGGQEDKRTGGQGDRTK